MSYSCQRGLSRLEILLIILVTLLILVIFVPYLFPRRYPGPRIEALNNAKAIAGGLVAFKTEMGHYPCDATRVILNQKQPEKILPDGKDANAYFAQLVVLDYIDDEGFFYASGMKGAIKGDNLKNSPEKLLSPGENCFAYVMTTNGQPLTDVTSKTPLVLAHLKSGGSNPTFHPLPFDGKGVAGLVDGSGAIFTINEKGHAISKDGKALFATGADSLFGKETPVVVAPKMK